MALMDQLEQFQIIIIIPQPHLLEPVIYQPVGILSHQQYQVAVLVVELAVNGAPGYHLQRETLVIA